MKIKTLLPIILVLAAVVIISGCTQTTGTGNLVLQITDKPDLNIEKADVTISMVQVHKAATGETDSNGNGNGNGNETNGNGNVSLEAQGNGQGNGDGNGANGGNGDGNGNVNEPEGIGADWIIVVEGPVTYDLVAIKDVYEYLGGAELESGRYTQIRLTVDSALVTINGTEYELTIPSGTVKMVKSFLIEDGKTTTLTLDFDAQQSVHETGAGRYTMRPTIRVLSEAEVDESDNGNGELSLEEKCTDSGGTVTTSLCCLTTEDFPNLCLVGPCGCSPDNSHEINICDCGEGKCFDGEACVDSE